MNMIKSNQDTKVLLAGGGTGGPVAPLLAIAEYLRHHNPQTEFLLVGGYHGPEQRMAAGQNIPFVPVPAGKLHRYATLKTLLTPFLVIAGFFKALVIIQRFKPTVAVGAGSFIQVPVLWAAWILRVPILIHQQDIHPTLANTLCALIAKKITVSFQKSEKDFSHGSGFRPLVEQKSKVIFTGNPTREFIVSAKREEAAAFFKLLSDKPTLLVLGGGTGAEAINQLIWEDVAALCTFVQVIHGVGIGKLNQRASEPDYHGFEFIDRMDLAYAAADIVLARAGISTIAELSKLKKISIIIPMPHTHQELNAAELEARQAALVFDQEQLQSQELFQTIRNLLLDRPLQQQLQQNIGSLMPQNAAQQVSEQIIAIAKQ